MMTLTAARALDRDRPPNAPRIGLPLRALLAAAALTLLPWTATQADVTLEADEYVIFQHHDALGSPIAATDAEGNVLWYEYNQPYGTTLGRTYRDGRGHGADPFNEDEGRSRVGYTGHVRDGASGLTYMQARHYDPELGRFLSNDPVGFLTNNPLSFNRYAYANNNPYAYIDPDGRQAEDPTEDSDNDGVPDSRDNDTNHNIVQDLNPAGNSLSVGSHNQAGAAPAVSGRATTGGAGEGRSFGSWVKSLFGPNSAANRNGLNKQLASEQQMSETGKPVAGAEGQSPFRGAKRAADQHGGSPSDWVKKSSSSHTAPDGTKFETHWVENVRTGQRVEFKTKY